MGKTTTLHVHHTIWDIFFRPLLNHNVILILRPWTRCSDAIITTLFHGKIERVVIITVKCSLPSTPWLLKDPFLLFWSTALLRGFFSFLTSYFVLDLFVGLWKANDNNLGTRPRDCSSFKRSLGAKWCIVALCSTCAGELRTYLHGNRRALTKCCITPF